jgi:serine/threonine-protein kinase
LAKTTKRGPVDSGTHGSVTDVDPTRLRSPPDGVSRVDTLPDDFVAMLSRRPFVPGDVLANRYKLSESLGEGAMGQVFIAQNLGIGRRVAVKLLKPELLADSSFRQRFQQEATATAAIEHRNVARFLDLVVADPTFLVMEYVPGPTLSAVLKRERRLDWVRAVNLGVRLCWALDAAHQHGIVHRDVKPANVILTPDPELGEEPKLIDFGLAKLPTMVGAENLTRTGQIVGTPHYMSPEQIANREVDPRSDVYALGCLLYHMLAGAPPFHGGDDVQVLYKQIREPAPPLAPLMRDAPPELAAVIERAILKEPDARFQSMRALADALGKINRRQPPLAEAEVSTEVTRPAPPPPSPRSPWPLALACALVAAMGASLGVHFAERRPPASAGGALFLTSRPDHVSLTVDGVAAPERTPARCAACRPESTACARSSRAATASSRWWRSARTSASRSSWCCPRRATRSRCRPSRRARRCSSTARRCRARLRSPCRSPTTSSTRCASRRPATRSAAARSSRKIASRP